MTEKKTKKTPEKVPPEHQASAVKPAMESAETEIKQIETDLEKARREAADYLDSLQRLKAEFDNFKKRMLREQSEFLRMAGVQIVEQLLPVLDNFERAVAVGADGAGVDTRRGVELVYEQLRDILSKEGLSPIDPAGQPFDPLRHEAMMQGQADNVPEDTVLEVFEKGYEFRGRVIRPARVKVAKPGNEP